MRTSLLISMLGLIVRMVGYAAGAVVAGLVALTFVVPRMSGTVPLTVLTGSMSPTIPAGSLVLVRPVDPEDVEVDDVITFESRSKRGHYTTHRVVAVDRQDGNLTFTTQGDANAGPDLQPVAADAVRGRVQWHVPVVGELTTRLRQSTTVIVVATGTLLVVVASAIGRRGRREVLADSDLSRGEGQRDCDDSASALA